MPDISPGAFLSFLLNCRTFDPAYDQPREIRDYPFISSLAGALEKHERLLVVKSRQMMASWIGCAFILFRALGDGPGIHLVLSKEERSARELINRIRFLLDHLPDDMKSGPIKGYSGSIAFPERGSRILSLPAAPYAVRGLSPHTLFWDEMAFTPNDEEIWAAVKPAVDAGGRFFAVSTPNGPSGVFARLVHSGESRFHIHRIHYRQNPEKNTAWEASARAGLSPARWRREQELSFEGAEGRVYDQFEESEHLLDTPYLPGKMDSVGIYRGIDFGYRRPAVVWAEHLVDGTIVLFDCLVGDRWPLSQLVEEMHAVDRKYGISENDVIWTAVDPAGAARTDTGISPVEALQAAGFNLIWSPSSIAAGIEVVRARLRDAGGNIRLKVDRRCGPLVRAFQGYAWGPDGELPVKDGEHDHPMDALRYLLVNLQRSMSHAPAPQPRVKGLARPNHHNPVDAWTTR